MEQLRLSEEQKTALAPYWPELLRRFAELAMTGRSNRKCPICDDWMYPAGSVRCLNCPLHVSGCDAGCTRYLPGGRVPEKVSLCRFEVFMNDLPTEPRMAEVEKWAWEVVMLIALNHEATAPMNPDLPVDIEVYRLTRCRSCRGQGGHEFRENMGECHGVPAYQTGYEPCDSCWGSGKCPLCGVQWREEDFDAISEAGVCPVCGWDWADPDHAQLPGEPDPEVPPIEGSWWGIGADVDLIGKAANRWAREMGILLPERPEDQTLILAKLGLLAGEVGEATHALRLIWSGQVRHPKDRQAALDDFAEELADVIIRACDLGRALKLDLGQAVDRKFTRLCRMLSGEEDRGHRTPGQP